ncbi:MAG: hypothetical protein ACJ74O_16200 [Frankiaceae bacterium]
MDERDDDGLARPAESSADRPERNAEDDAGHTEQSETTGAEVAAAPAQGCLYQGNLYPLGAQVCMTVGAGRVIAICGNNGRWTLTGTPC